jgi:basic membrane protein A
MAQASETENTVKKAISLVALAAAGALLLGACGNAPAADSGTTAATTTAPATTSAPATDTAPTDAGSAGPTSATVANFLPCIVSDQGGFDDKSFNQSAFQGVKDAATQLGLGDKFKSVQSTSDNDYAPNLQAMADDGCTLIVSVGFALSQATIDAATANPNLQYMLVDDPADANGDGKPDAPNIKTLLYDTAQAAYLAGYLSAGFSTTGKIGTYGGQNYPTVSIYMDGFLQGANAYNADNGKNVQVIGWDGTNGVFTGGFSANDQAYQAAASIISQGVDVLLPVGGPIYQSGMSAIKDSGKSIALIGVDADFFVSDPSTQDIVLTSILKNIEVSVNQNILDASQGKMDFTPYVGTLANGGVGLAPLHNFESKVDPALVTKVASIQQEIIAGTRTVKSYLAG